MSIYYSILYFFVYGFLGWCTEVIFAAFKQHRFVNRGFLNGPICPIYGVGVTLVIACLEAFQSNLLLLYISSVILVTVLEGVTGWAMDKLFHNKWWDYSNKKWNMDGYICLQYSVLWGILGVLALKFGNILGLTLLHLAPNGVMHITLWILFGVLVVDAIGSYAVLRHITKKMPRITAMNDQIDAFTKRLSVRLYRYLEARVERAYPSVQPIPKQKEKSEVFAEGCSFYKIILLFIIGAFLGDIVETIFCRITAGVWMSRSSLVWGPFSIVWGLAIALATWFLYNYRNRSDGFLFAFGTFLGGAYEYLCSVFTEIVFGKVFWDYSDIPFNLGGRINLLYCFFWGIAAVVWLKKLYPLFSKWIEKIPLKQGHIITWILIIFMLANILVSTLALTRYDQRAHNEPAANAIEQLIDERFPDSRMEKIYPNAKMAS
mgnify:CR=1 FL=1